MFVFIASLFTKVLSFLDIPNSKLDITWELGRTIFYALLILTFYILNQKLEDGFLQSQSKDDLLQLYNSLGDHVFYLWSMFMRFHRFVYIYI